MGEEFIMIFYMLIIGDFGRSISTALKRLLGEAKREFKTRFVYMGSEESIV